MNTSHSSKRNGPPQVVHQPRGGSSVVNPAYQHGPPHLPQYQQPIIPQPAQPYLPYPTIPPAVQGEGNIVLYYVPPYHMCIMYVLPHK